MNVSSTMTFFGAALLLAAIQLPSQGETVLLRNATVHSVTGEVIEGGDVLIRDGLIADVGENLSGDADETVELDGKHVYPGMIAPFTSLGLVEINAVRATRDTSEVGAYTPDVQAWIAVNPDSELIPVARASGITHVVVTPQGGTVSGQAGLIALAGWTYEEMAVKTPAALQVWWPSMNLNADWERNSGLSDQIKRREERVREVTEFFHEALAYQRAKESGADDLIETPAWEAMLPALRKEIPVVVQADDQREIEAVLEWAKELDLKLVIVGGRDAWKLAPKLADAGVGVIYGSMFGLPPRQQDGYDIQFRAPKILADAGVKVAFTEGVGGSAAAHIRNLPYAAAQAVAFGMSRDEAVRALTLNPAEMFGVSEKLGSIEKGKEASLIVTSGDLLDIRSNVERLWIRGKEVSIASKHTRLYEKYKGRPRPNVP